MNKFSVNEQKIQQLLSCCNLCPRKCGANRWIGERGFCGSGREVRIARAALHYWEEPCISGENGSGTVFFSNCTMKCVYCQNYEVSTNNLGYEISVDDLSQTFIDLQKKGANNINLVTPTHYVPQIMQSLILAKDNGLTIPIVYNTGGYENVETIEMLHGLIDIYMPDFKYFKDATAQRYSSAKGYCDTVKAAVDAMLKSVGKPCIDENGLMKKGVIIRHLMLPGCLSETLHIIDYISSQYGDDVYFSLMSQYTPLRRIDRYEKLNHKVERKYYDFAVDRCVNNGMKNVFIQEGEAADESFVPKFSGNYEQSL